MFIKLFIEDGSVVIVKKEDISRIIAEFDSEGKASCTVVYAPRGEEVVSIPITNEYFAMLRTLEL